MRAKALGNVGEKKAVEMLQKRGMKILHKNWRSKIGEVDIIARDGNVVVFVEVKAKSSGDFGRPHEMVTEWKINQVKRLGELWAQEYEWEGGMRMDVVGLVIDPNGEVEDEKYYKNA